MAWSDTATLSHWIRWNLYEFSHAIACLSHVIEINFMQNAFSFSSLFFRYTRSLSRSLTPALSHFRKVFQFFRSSHWNWKELRAFSLQKYGGLMKNRLHNSRRTEVKVWSRQVFISSAVLIKTAKKCQSELPLRWILNSFVCIFVARNFFLSTSASYTLINVACSLYTTHSCICSAHTYSDSIYVVHMHSRTVFVCNNDGSTLELNAYTNSK